MRAGGLIEAGRGESGEDAQRGNAFNLICKKKILVVIWLLISKGEGEGMAQERGREGKRRGGREG